MLASFFRKVTSGVWRHSSENELPIVTDERSRQNPATHQFLVLAGGIALVLSRANPDQQRRRFRATAKLYELLKSELQRYGRTSATGMHLLDSFHEVAQELDPLSREAFKLCLEWRRQYEAGLLERSAPQGQPPAEPAVSTGAFASRALPLESLQMSGPESPTSSLVVKPQVQRVGVSSAAVRPGS